MTTFLPGKFRISLLMITPQLKYIEWRVATSPIASIAGENRKNKHSEMYLDFKCH